MPVTQNTLDEIALSRAEYEAIVDLLGREPSDIELGLFGALWSEHCGYKHSKFLLRTLPAASPRLLVGPGIENAGVIDIGDGLSIVMKIESHNHPSAVEPREGASTGVGGIVRDIFAMGARPIALLNSLRFGHLITKRNRYLIAGVISGISDYGNCIGVPDIGGEIVFADEYAENPLVNAMCIGLIEDGNIMSAAPKMPGDLAFLVGAETGLDGIHGASGLASRSFEGHDELRSAVQVGNPFLEKVLIEACLEASRLEGVVGMQDLGAAGLTSAAIEAADRAGLGVKIDVGQVPRREEGMTPYEVMLSESQERMLLMVSPGHQSKVQAVFAKWDLGATQIGEFTPNGLAEIYDGETRLSSTPISTLTNPPEYKFNAQKPDWLNALQDTDLSKLPLPDISPSELLLKMLSSPNIASRHAVFRRYDHQVQTNTVLPPGGDAAILRLKGSKRGIAAATDGNGRYCYLDPFAGGVIAVAEACRNITCVGATPVAITDCLNFGNPEKPDIQYQLSQAISGIREACNALKVPVISGNVSLYNETMGTAIYPTPIIGALGLLEDVNRHTSAGFKDDGDAVFLIHSNRTPAGVSSLGGSEYLALMFGRVDGRPQINIASEVAVQNLCRIAIEQNLIKSAHDCSDGGLAVAIAESSIIGGIGVKVSIPNNDRLDAALFGESQSRIVITLDPNDIGHLDRLAVGKNVSITHMGTVGGDQILISDLVDIPIANAVRQWEYGLELAMAG